MKKIIFIIIFLVLLIIFLLFFLFLSDNLIYSEIKNNTVVRVIDGDTFEIYNSDLNEIFTIRLICIDTPEKDEEGYENAMIFLSELILGKQVSLEKGSTDKDKYGRLLRFVYVDEIFVNKFILDNNYGKLMIFNQEDCEKLV